MVAHKIDEQLKLKRELTKQAVSLATSGNWEEAIEKNRQILTDFPNDAEALNRLGKALSQIGNYSKARTAFRKVLSYSPTNGIAKKNLERIATLGNNLGRKKTQRPRVTPHFFIEEMGKTGSAELIDKAPKQILATMSSGDQVDLEQENQRILVKTSAGELLGIIDSKVSLRLISLMRGGNRYSAAVSAVGTDNLRVFMKETYQHPSQKGRLSFPPKANEVQSYTGDNLSDDLVEDEELLNTLDSSPWEDEDDLDTMPQLGAKKAQHAIVVPRNLKEA